MNTDLKILNEMWPNQIHEYEKNTLFLFLYQVKFTYISIFTSPVRSSVMKMKIPHFPKDPRKKWRL